MKSSSKLVIALTVGAVMFGSFQVEAFPKPGSLSDSYKQIPIVISKPRGNENFDYKPQPGFDVTLLRNQTVHFAWEGKSTGTFIIKDDKGKQIFEKVIGDTRSFDISPSAAKLKAGKKYSWSVDGKNFYKFTVLDAKTEKELLNNLAEFDEQELSSEERILKKAFYVQQLSDDPQNNLDLYWLSAQWLAEISPTDNELKNKKQYLIEQCDDHHLVVETRWFK